MTTFYNTLHEEYLGYSAIFICIGMAFLFLRKVYNGEAGPGYWAMSFFMGSVGFMFWSGIVPLLPWQYYLVGETFHITGFFSLVCGAYRFTGYEYKRWNIFFVIVWAALWIGSIMLMWSDNHAAALALKLLRSVLFVGAGIMILGARTRNAIIGRGLAGWSLIAWGLYITVLAFIKLHALLNLAFGFLVGFQILAALGMVVMMVDRIKIRATDSEKKIERLEGLLPICSYCKNIRGKDNQWQALESYIEDRSTAEFSHGICPDCLEKHHPSS